MISRKTARVLADSYAWKFAHRVTYSPNAYGQSIYHTTINVSKFSDFLYEHDYDLWFYRKARGLKGFRAAQEFVMGLHSGETQLDNTPDWTWQQREQLGQKLLVNLAEDILNDPDIPPNVEYGGRPAYNKADLIKQLELDGYIYRNARLLAPESDVLNAQQESGLLETLYTSLNLANRDTVLHHLALSEEHYLNNKWDDSISNSRKFLECVLQEVAAAFSLKYDKTPLPQNTYLKPVEVRKYLETKGLIDTKDREALDKVYGLLSERGGHPHIANNDQARLLRHLALTFSQYVMLSFEAVLKTRTN